MGKERVGRKKDEKGREQGGKTRERRDVNIGGRVDKKMEGKMS